MNIKPLFPTPIAVTPNFISSKERLQLMKSIKSIPHTPHDCIIGEGLSTHGQSSSFLDRNIKKRIQNEVDNYNDITGFAPSDVDNIWSNIQNAGSRLAEHTHPHACISGSLYINVGEEGKLYFHNPNPYIVFSDRDRLTPYNFEFQWIDVKNCELVLFPSCLKHVKYTEINEMDDRIVVSFNCKRRTK